MGDSINPGLFNPDFSSHANAGMIAGQALSGLGGDIGGVIKERKAQQKRDGQNEKFLQQALDMFQGTELEGPVGNAYEQYISEETTDKQRRAIGESIRETIGLGMAAQELKMKQAALSAGGADWKPRYQEVPVDGGGTMLMEVAPDGSLHPLRADMGLPGQQAAPQPEETLDGSFWYGQPVDQPVSAGATVSGAPGVLPPRQADPNLRVPIEPAAGWDSTPSISGDPAPIVGDGQDEAGRIMAALASGGGQPAPADAGQGISGAIGYTPPKPTDKYEQFLRDGELYQKNVADGKISKVGGGGININMGREQDLTPADFSKGWRTRTNESGVTERYAIPGSEAANQMSEWAEKAEDEKRKQTAGEKGRVQGEKRSGRLVREIDRALAEVDSATQGDNPIATLYRVGKGGALPGSPEFKIDRAVKAMKNMIMLDELKKLRDASPTGASGMGQLNKSEGDALRDQHGALSNIDDPQLLKENLIDLRNNTLDAVHGTRAQREQWLKEGVITPQQNLEVEKMYGNHAPVSQPKAPLPTGFDPEFETLLEGY
jgi:hypothetical protein